MVFNPLEKTMFVNFARNPNKPKRTKIRKFNFIKKKIILIRHFTSMLTFRGVFPFIRKFIS